MATKIINIKNAIKTKLDGVSHLKYVYTYANGSPDGFPCATITNSQMQGEFGDFSATSKRNKRTYAFNVSIYVERNEASFGAEKAERVTDEALDEILTAFDMDTTLSGVVKWVQVVEGDLSYEDMGNIVRTANLTISCIDMVDSL
jgi:hypothetical protein